MSATKATVEIDTVKKYDITVKYINQEKKLSVAAIYGNPFQVKNILENHNCKFKSFKFIGGKG